MDKRRRTDPIALEVFANRFAAIAEEMGVVLGRTASSPNIKERRDFSCALFDGMGSLVAQAAHIPVHLGSTPLSVAAAIDRGPLGGGDVVLLNDPYGGGTHLPDLTVVAPVYLPGGRRPFAYVANRAHHADVGGMTPGSMPLAREIYQEGLRLPPIRIVRGGVMDRDLLGVFLANARVPDEREGDLLAQLAALRAGCERVQELAAVQGERRIRRAMAELQDYGERLMRAALRRIPDGRYRAVDFLDDDGLGSGAIRIAVRIVVRGARATTDFQGSAPQVTGSVNANFAVTLSAVVYVMMAISGSTLPVNAGLLRPIRVIAPAGTVVNARFPAPVAGGNVETAQRIVDVLLRALARALPELVPAASCGSMNNIAVGGYDPFRGREFSYYETVAGGAGAGPLAPGASAVHTHMTNTMNTPIEALEAAYPLLIRRYAVRRDSGGAGWHRGGDGAVREIEVLSPARVTLLGERRRRGPYGLAGGRSGRPGRDRLRRRGRWSGLPSKVNFDAQAADVLRIETPGGGGWGMVRGRGLRAKLPRPSRF